MTPGCFAIEQKGEPFGVIECRGIARGFDVGEGLSHAEETQGMQLIESGMSEHVGFS